MRKSCLIFLFICMAVNSYAACPAPVGTTYTAVDASSAEVQDCINDCDTAGGGTVVIPSGSATYDATHYITKTLTNNLVLQGSGIASTIITDGGADKDIPAIKIVANGTTRIEISNFKLITKTAVSNDGGSMEVSGTSPNKIIHDMYFDMTGITGGRMLKLGNYDDVTHGYGVVYRSTFYNTTDKGQSVSIFGRSAGDYNYWSGNPSFGTANAWFIEGCTFTNTTGDGDGALDAYGGAKIVWRYNDVSGTNIGWHGNDSSSGLHSIEIYLNNITDPNNQAFKSIGGRGGTSIIWGNTLDALTPPTFLQSLYRSCDEGGFNPDTICNGSGTRDGNSDATGWPCYQQHGTTGNDGITSWPMVEWNNTVAGVSNNGIFALNSSFIDSSCTDYKIADTCTGAGVPLACCTGAGTGTCTEGELGLGGYDMADHVKEERDYLNHDSCSDSVDNDGDGLTDMDDPQCIAFWDNVNSKALLNGSAYIPYTCPHPLAGTGSCDSGTAGTGGYHFGNMGIGSGPALTIGSGAAITLN